ncbi:LIM and senescent cell antigen-like-containing domain protein 2 isoform X2 [Kogia breviceps]|uniref:LIM and senescent cell antigen-like-containing domain protein 2 isoform X2 n=2 Tax=Kogia breviceps TaxID=27615 RepID=UPI0034D2E6CD
MPWPMPCASAARPASPPPSGSSTATESCTTSAASCAPSASGPSPRGSSTSLPEGRSSPSRPASAARGMTVPSLSSVCWSRLQLEGRKYCEHDFQMLFAPCCRTCGEFIIGRVIKAMNNNWHPGCFRCELCDVELADLGFVKNAGRHLCRPCHNREKAKGLGKYICQRCHLVIDEQPLMFRNDAYHPDHFSCTHCGKELTAEARELKGELYCLPCHDKMGVPICGACRRPIEGRVVNALGKQWHVEHFVCAKCEKPFLGHRHYEKKGLAYCETHYNQLFGDVCYTCSHVIEGDVVSALNKAWCVHCFSCSTCNSRLTLKNKFVEFDMKPVCKRCYEKFPLELKKRLKKLSELAARRAQPKSAGLQPA